MSHAIDWYLDNGVDPVPGDPGVVETVGGEYQDVALAIVTAASRLDEIAAAAQDGDADFLKEIEEKAKTVAKDIRKARERYGETGTALVTYATALRSAQTEATAALSKARGARSTIHTEQAKYDQYSDPDVQQSMPSAQGIADQAEQDLATARGELTSAQTQLDGAIGARDTAAGKAAGVVRGVIEKDDLNDGWWENVRGVVNVITDIAGKIAAVAGILALVFCWVPGLGQALAAIALIAGAISFIGESLKLMNGEGDWVSWGLGLLGLVTFGAGRVIGTSLKLGAKGVQGLSRVRADQYIRATRGAQGVKSAVRNLLGRRGLEGIKAGERAMTEFASGRGLWQVTRSALRPRALAGDLWSDLKGFGKVGEFLRHPVGTWKSVFDGTSGLQRVTAFFGAGDEARAISSLAAADDVVRSLDGVADASRYANAAAAGLAGNSVVSAANEGYQRFRDIDQGKTDWFNYMPDNPAETLKLG